MGLRRLRFWACPALLLACESSPSPTCDAYYDEAVVVMAAWERVELVADPFAEDQPPDPACPESETVAEGSWYEVDTGACNYLTVSQPLQTDLAAGTPISIAIAHYALTAAEPFDAHAAVRMGDTTIWELSRHVDPPDAQGNPSVPYEAIEDEVTLDGELSAGTPIYFHLHNHGYNTWNLLSVDARRCEAP